MVDSDQSNPKVKLHYRFIEKYSLSEADMLK